MTAADSPIGGSIYRAACEHLGIPTFIDHDTIWTVRPFGPRGGEPWTWELSAYGRGDWGGHYARRRSDDGVERHADGQPCGCPNAAAYAPMTPARLAGWLALAFIAFDRIYPPRGCRYLAAYVLWYGLLTPHEFAAYVLTWP